MSRTRETTHTFFVMYLSPLKPKSCAGNNSQVKKACSMQGEQLLFCSFFTPINIQQVPLSLQGI